MNVVKEEFKLLKDTPNFLDFPLAELKSILVEKGPAQVYAYLKLQERRIDHFTKSAVYELINNPRTREKIHLVVYPEYSLPVSFNRPTKGIVINLSAFGTDDISRVDPRNIYACLVYGLSFHSLSSGVDASPMSFSIINYLLSVFVRSSMFGKKFGLLGIYAREINKLKFLISCYVLISFFGAPKHKAYTLASSASFFDYKPIVGDLDKFDFSSIEDFITSLSFLKVMPGINKYSFTSTFIKHFHLNFIPGLEDVSRFVSSLIVASLKGSGIIPTFISSFNEDEFSKIVKFGQQMIFKGA
jgi:hypothetical protein